MAYRLYVAGPWADRPYVNEQAQKLRDAGYTVDARWLTIHAEGDGDLNNEDPANQEFYREQALNDIEDLLQADALFLVNTQKSEGKAVETGIAIATLKPTVMVGKRTNVFHTLNIPRFDTTEDAIVWMKAQEEAEQPKQRGIDFGG